MLVARHVSYPDQDKSYHLSVNLIEYNFSSVVRGKQDKHKETGQSSAMSSTYFQFGLPEIKTSKVRFTMLSNTKTHRAKRNKD